MRKEIEQRPVDTKVLREHFRKGLERQMNKLMSEGYIPVGGTSTHMNTHTKPILGIDAQEYTQTMVKYTGFEVWVKESDMDFVAFSDEQSRQSLIIQRENLKKAITKDLKTIKELEKALTASQRNETEAKSFFGKIKHSFDTAVTEGRKQRLSATNERVATNKPRYIELSKQLEPLNNRLDKFYKSNPSVTKDILLNSR